MPKIPVLKPRQVITILEKMGFAAVRQKGSHIQLKHPDGRQTTVPNHKGRDLSPLLLKKIIKDIKTSIEEFLSNI